MMYIIEKFTVIGQMHGWLDCQTFLLINQAKFVKTEFKFFRMWKQLTGKEQQKINFSWKSKIFPNLWEICD